MNLSFLSVLSLVFVGAVEPLSTVAERTGFQKTGHYVEVVSLCREFQKEFPGKVRCLQYGTTPEQRPLMALVASQDGLLDAEKAKKAHRPVVLFQGGIHAGEIDGKDAGFWVLRDLLQGKAVPGALAKVVLVFVPVVNPDGHERFGRNQRPNQNGPDEAGWRTTARNLNMNRDYTKADAPETAALLGLLGEWDPILYVDLHVTDGARFEQDVAVLVEPTNVGPEELRKVGLELRDAVLTRLVAQDHLPVPFYPAFRTDDDPSSGFAVGVAPPRFSNAYWPLRNRFAALVETHSWRNYRHRVRTSRDVMLAFIAGAMKSGAAWLAAADEADQVDRTGVLSELALDWENTENNRPLKFRGYAYSVEKSQVSGANWIRYDTARPKVWEVPLFYELRPSQTVRLPRGGYLVPAAHAAWVEEKLKLHGLAYQVLGKAREVEVEVFRATEAKFQPAPYEGRQPVAVKGAWKSEKRALPAGTLYVPVGQRGKRLLAHLLEPTGRDSFLSWGFFNTAFERKEYMESYVAEEVARAMLKASPELKAEFEQRLASDADFAKSPESRLDFFYRQHPSWDERVNLYPVFRTDLAYEDL